MAAVEGNYDFALTKVQLDRRWGGEGRGDHGEATDELGNAFSRWRARTTTTMVDGCGLGAACGEGEREANGAGGAFGQALALFWSADARRGGFGRA